MIFVGYDFNEKNRLEVSYVVKSEIQDGGGFYASYDSLDLA